MKVVDVKTEKILDTNPNIYLERAEKKLKNGQYEEALEDAGLAVKYSKNKSRVVEQRVAEQYNRIKSAVDEHYARLDPGKFIRAAEQCFQNGKYDESIKQAEMAVKYSDNNKKYIKDLNRIKSMIEAKQNELRRLEKEADSHMEIARKLINSSRYDEALKEARAGIACVNSNKYSNEFNSIESIVRQKKAEAQADKSIERAKYMLNNGEYDKALIEARAAINYSSNSKYMNEFNKIKAIVENREAEIQADRAIEKAKLLINNGEYYKALEEANRALNLSNNHNCHAKYIKELNNIESSLKQLPKEQLHIIADEYRKNNLLYKAKEWYKSTNDARAYYEIGKIDFYKFNNKEAGISYLKKAADMKYMPALVRLIHIYVKGAKLKKDFSIASKYYKILKKVDKLSAKKILSEIKDKYKLSMADMLKIKGLFKIIVTVSSTLIISLCIALSVLQYRLFKNGTIKPIIYNQHINIDENNILVGSSTQLKESHKIFPFYGVEPVVELKVSNAEIATLDEQNVLTGIKEGDVEISAVSDGKASSKINVSIVTPKVEKFKIKLESEISKVGDSTKILTDIVMNNNEAEKPEIIYTSSNDKAVTVDKNGVINVIGTGDGYVKATAGNMEDTIKFSIKSTNNDDNIKDFKFNVNTGTITKYTGSKTEVVIPNEINGVKVKSIGDSAFKLCRKLTSVVIPSSVISIEKYAFAYCDRLTSITIPNSATSIGVCAFSGCGLSSITIPKSVTSIGSGAFACLHLQKIIVSDGNEDYISIDDVLFNKSKTKVIQYPAGKENKNYIIPNSVTSIEGMAFSDCSRLTSITIPNGVTSIGDYAFSICTGLSSINIPDSVISIGEGAFNACSNITSNLKISKNVTNIGNYAFNACDKAVFHVEGQRAKQLLINTGVSESKIILN